MNTLDAVQGVLQREFDRKIAKARLRKGSKRPLIPTAVTRVLRQQQPKAEVAVNVEMDRG